ncbi:NAD(P)/FAD-dependent oxidoreductase [Nocardioides sp. zg-1228]|uniref:NAD(P)/FAD-dependent oxidoreductase n=1 Tax=Nocardioides sp. zg-1228 TaxID=2763008 RepID=UPI001642D7BA|nr:NAD(P)/FAD-dependent oxidoreductase [Nocardioides sp. zg-1228]MBC2933584.1 NAD(P)/FAD-dependent oxidoreductase [Nocardioides sp. zg-1228]QSF56289.1 NAD(P)/FAD-dependent oxidoreductase [Nocardioides sp. zg-1228]
MSRAPATEHWDLVVVGAGPAGSATALGALAEQPGLRVLLVDRSDFPRDKSCGDGIAPHVLDALAPVGAADVVDDWTPLRHLELAHGDVSVSGPMRREVHVVPRRVLDARLVERAVAAGAVLRTHRVTSLTSTGTPVVSGTVSADVVVGADGAHSVVRTTLLGKRRDPRAIAIRGYAPTTPEMAGRQVIRYGSRRQPSYAWAFDRGDGLANVGYGELLPGERTGDRAPSRRLLLEQLEELVPGAARTGDDWRGHHLPLSSWRWDQPDGPVLLAGDAAGLVNPMTGEGIYYAVATGIAAGRTAAQAVRAGRPHAAGARHRRVVRDLLGTHLRHTWAASRLAQSPRIVDAGIRAAGRERHAFDTLVELGLGDGRIDTRLAGGLLRALLRPPDPSPEPSTQTRGG